MGRVLVRWQQCSLAHVDTYGIAADSIRDPSIELTASELHPHGHEWIKEWGQRYGPVSVYTLIDWLVGRCTRSRITCLANVRLEDLLVGLILVTQSQA